MMNLVQVKSKRERTCPNSETDWKPTFNLETHPRANSSRKYLSQTPTFRKMSSLGYNINSHVTWWVHFLSIRKYSTGLPLQVIFFPKAWAGYSVFSASEDWTDYEECLQNGFLKLKMVRASLCQPTRGKSIFQFY